MFHFIKLDPPIVRLEFDEESSVVSCLSDANPTADVVIMQVVVQNEGLQGSEQYEVTLLPLRPFLYDDDEDEGGSGCVTVKCTQMNVAGRAIVEETFCVGM